MTQRQENKKEKRVILFVEGSGQQQRRDLKKANRRYFYRFLESAGLDTSSLDVQLCGDRGHTLRVFRQAWSKARPEDFLAVLIDSDEVAANLNIHDPWQHIAKKGSQKPARAKGDNLHFMVTCTEALVVADRNALLRSCGRNLDVSALPKPTNVENVTPEALLNALKRATKRTGIGDYKKGKHTLMLLGSTSANQVASVSPWTKRFLNVLRREL